MALQEVQTDSKSLISLMDLNLLGIIKITELMEEDAVGKGESYSSIVRRLKITGVDTQGLTVRKNLVLKKIRGVQSIEDTIFKCEIQVYKEILPLLKDLIVATKNNSLSDLLWPECCGVRNYDMILLEDLVEAGYAMRNRRIPLSAEIATFVAEQLGKFHALSRVAISRKLIDPHSLQPNKFADTTPLINDIFASGLRTLANKLENESQWKSVSPKLRSMAKDIGRILAKVDEDVKDVYPVINHGDCWTNNMLFKYDKATNIPISLKFVDFQATHYSCFAWDLTNFMHSSMSGQTRQHCYTKMMERYRSSLIKTMEILQEDSSDVPDMNRMLRTMDQLAPYGLVAAVSWFPLTVSTLEVPIDLEKPSEGDFTNFHSPELYDNETFKESFLIDVEKFKNLGLL